MNFETKQCQNCKKDFTIEPDDFAFYERIKVPTPTFCPECRLQRRLAGRENRPFYKGVCYNCGEKIISIFNDNLKIKTYCTNCFWGDSWDAIEYGLDYDFSKSFFEQFCKLREEVPREAVLNKNNQNCTYSSGDVRCKDCVLTFGCVEAVNCYNAEAAVYSRDCLDSDCIFNADSVYENFNCNGVYNTKFTYFSDECIDCFFIYNCVGCSNCFGCVNLKNKKYCIFNEQHTKEEYIQKVSEWNLDSYDVLLKAKEKFKEICGKTPRRFAIIKNSFDVTGQDIKNTKNCKNCFVTRQGVENCKFIFLCGLLLKDSYDATFGGDESELFYENSGGMQSQRCFFTRAPYSSKDIQYSDRLTNCSDCFGCINLKNKQYCIFNKQYTKEEYEALVPKIITQMNEIPYIDKRGLVYKYGEFFPSELSLWGYNETWAHKYFRLKKEETTEKGFNWQDNTERNNIFDIKAVDLADKISEVSDDILGKIILCEHYIKTEGQCNHQCNQFFKILPYELSYYKKMNLPLPRLCPNCRHYERTDLFMNPLRLWHRKCMKSGCANEFETSYASERSEIIYCDTCYKEEFLA